MIIALYCVAAAMVFGGVYAALIGWEYVIIERGWTQVLVGTMAATGGVLLAGLATLVDAVRRVERRLAAAPAPARMTPQLPEQPAPFATPAPPVMPERPARANAPEAALAGAGGAILATGLLAGKDRPDETGPRSEPAVEPVDEATAPAPVVDAPSPDAPVVATAVVETAFADATVVEAGTETSDLDSTFDETLEIFVAKDRPELSSLPEHSGVPEPDDTPPAEDGASVRDGEAREGAPDDDAPIEPERDAVDDDASPAKADAPLPFFRFPPRLDDDVAWASEGPLSTVQHAPSDSESEARADEGGRDDGRDVDRGDMARQTALDEPELRESIDEPARPDVDAVEVGPVSEQPGAEPEAADFVIERSDMASLELASPELEARGLEAHELDVSERDVSGSAEPEPAIPETDPEALEPDEPDLDERDFDETGADETPAVIGTYESGGNIYTMYADGSIKAQTDEGEFRFASLDELKTFIAEGGEDRRA
ncbi:MAG: hypothetical protein MEP57_01725 [Microvirga sp.]|nr:hypothetical protein [Microvirga sp.]